MNRYAWLHPLVLGGWLIGWMALLGGSTRAELRPIVYVGTFAQEGDRSFLRFVQALERRHQDLVRLHPVRYVRVSDSDATLISGAIEAESRRLPAVLVTPTAPSISRV